MFYILSRARAFVPGLEASTGTGAAMVFSFAFPFPAFKPKSAATRLIPAKHVVSTMHGTRTVLLDARNGNYWGLDEVGSRIWSLMQEGVGPVAIAEKLTEEYDASLEDLERDVETFIVNMRRSKLLREGV